MTRTRVQNFLELRAAQEEKGSAACISSQQIIGSSCMHECDMRERGCATLKSPSTPAHTWRLSSKFDRMTRTRVQNFLELRAAQEEKRQRSMHFLPADHREFMYA